MAATYLHNLTTILTDNESYLNSGNLNYSIPEQPATVHDLLLQKSEGTFELVVWNEQLRGSTNVTVNLLDGPAPVTLFDPTLGTATIQTLGNTSSIALTLSNHPLILETRGR